jgi:hypothetical protein
VTDWPLLAGAGCGWAIHFASAHSAAGNPISNHAGALHALSVPLPSQIFACQ